MSDIGAMVDLLIEAGTPPGLAAQVVAQAFTAGAVSGGYRVEAAIEKRRAWDRDYRRRKRVNPPDIHPIPPDTQNASLSKEVKKEDNKEEREAPAKRVHPTRGQRLPDDWQPAVDDWQAALTAIGLERAPTELAKFRDHWKQQPGSRGVKLDWNAAWRNWIRRAAEYRGGPTNGRRTVHQAADDLLAKLRAFDEPAPGSLRGGEGEDAIRLLPPR